MLPKELPANLPNSLNLKMPFTLPSTISVELMVIVRTFSSSNSDVTLKSLK